MTMKVRLRAGLCLMLCGAAIAWSQTEMNVAELVLFLHLKMASKHHTEKQIATRVKKLKLTEKLTDKTIIDLQAEGAGQIILDALKVLQAETPAIDATYSPATAKEPPSSAEGSSIALSANAVPIPPPDSVTQQKILDTIRAYVQNYTANLPNFVCVQMTRQKVDPKGGENYRSRGTILAKVSYNEGQEHYNVYSINGKLTHNTVDKLRGVNGGATSTGEFASLMRQTFDPKSNPQFNWDHWGKIRGRVMTVFSYAIESVHSSYSLSYSDFQGITTAYNGSIYADPTTGEISRIKFVAVNIPKSFQIHEASEILDYELTDISGPQYVVPMAVQVSMRAGRGSDYNEIEFRNYRKYGTNSSIKYESALDPQSAPPPLPESQTKEQPARTSKPAPAHTTPFALPTAPPPTPPK